MNRESDLTSIIGSIEPSDSSAGRWSAFSIIAERSVFRLLTAVRFGRRYVLKTLRQPYADNAAYRAVMEREAALAARLDHQGIVRVEGMETIPGVGHAIVMEWVDGRTLAQYAAEHPSVADRRRIALEMAEALAYAHEIGTAHRDFKPDNVMISRRGNHVKIIDFGLGDAPDIVSGKPSRATPGYGAPEQLAEVAAAAGPEADVWSFGRVLSELDCGRRYDRIAAACMSEKPADRPPMADVVARLSAAGHTRRQWLWLAIAFSALIVIIGVVIMLLRTPPAAEVPAIKAPEAVAVDSVQPSITPPAPTPETLPQETPHPQPITIPTTPAAEQTSQPSPTPIETATATKKIMADAVAELQAIYDEQARFYTGLVAQNVDMKTFNEESDKFHEQYTTPEIKAVYTRFEKRLRAAGITDQDYYPLLGTLSQKQIEIQNATLNNLSFM